MSRDKERREKQTYTREVYCFPQQQQQQQQKKRKEKKRKE
jgi:hypothetical protein